MRDAGVRAACLALLFVVAAGVGSAAAATPGVGWQVESIARPTSFVTTEADRYTVLATNVGTVETSGRVTVTIVLPVGVTTSATPTGEWNCQPEGEGHGEVTCATEEPVRPLTAAPPLEVLVKVEGAEPSGPVPGRVTVSGGVPGCGEGTAPPCPTASVKTETRIGAAAVPFELLEEGFDTPVLNSAGSPDTAAGDHPGGLETALAVSSLRGIANETHAFEVVPAENIKQVVVDLPPGLVGDPLAAPTCSLTALSNFGACSPATQVGKVYLVQPSKIEREVALFNVTPEEGYPAEFGAFLAKSLKRAGLLYAHVGAYPNYQTEVISGPIDRTIELQAVLSTFFGDPAALDGSPLSSVAFFTNPSDCEASGFTTTIRVDTWQHPGRFKPDGEPVLENEPNWKSFSSTSPPVTGCGALQFHPTFSLQPTTNAPNSPSGLKVELQIPQNEDPQGLATPPLKDVTVALPQGLDVSPSSATGLEGCSEAQFELSSSAPGSCPGASQIGEVTVHTPLLAEPVSGQVFLGTPECDPCSAADAQDGRMIRLFMQISSKRYGLAIKSPGRVRLDPASGQLVSTFEDLPQDPFSDLSFKFKEGPRAPLATPSACGEYRTATSLTPWSTPYTPTAQSSPPFTISGCEGNPFTPAFTSGTVGSQAGRYAPFVLNFSRGDSEQDLKALEVTLPPGLLAKLAGLAECGESEIAAAAADSGECPAASQIGTLAVTSGPGKDPFYTTGKVYFSGPYNGGPYGVVTVVPAVAGPFNLGNVVVRGSIRINPTTAQASVVTDAFPSILDGIPLQVRSVSVSLERSGYTFNATSCEPMGIAGKLASTGGATHEVSSLYQAAGCRSMPFKPSFSASTQGATSKEDGASLHVDIAYHGGPDYKVGEEEANFRKVDVQLPVELPSRLTTLHKACSEQQFAENPAGCPAASDVGTAVVHTPLLAFPLEGPAYLVSHGGAAFPDLVLVLQGGGILVDMTGSTDIKKGITYSNFEAVPDAPFQSVELKLPEGPYSVLDTQTPETNLCALTKTVTVSKKVTKRVDGKTKKVTEKVKKTEPESLVMPTSITAQNGAVFTQQTKIAVTGCPKTTAAAAKRSAKQARRAGAAHVEDARPR
jgi:hypothetical protein